MTSKKPDWDDYPVIEGVQPPRVEVWEAVALSLDLDPKSLELDFSFGDDDLLGAFPDEAMERAFLRRLQQAQQNIFDERWFSEVQTSGRSKHFRSVLLPQFAAFAIHCGWECPARFRQIAKSPTPQPQSATAEGVEATQDRRLRDLEGLGGKWAWDGAKGKFGFRGERGAKKALIEQEKAAGRSRVDEKTVNADLTAAAERRRETTRQGAASVFPGATNIAPFKTTKVKNGKRTSG